MTTRLLRKCWAHLGLEVGLLSLLWVPFGFNDENVTVRSLGFPRSTPNDPLLPKVTQPGARTLKTVLGPLETDESSSLPISATSQPFDQSR